MTCRTPLTLSIAALCLFFASCNKSDSKPGNTTTTTTTTTTTGTLNMNCYPSFYGPQTEVIVSEPSGKILLDTVANNTGSPITASLNTTDTLVDVTEISPEQGSPTILAHTFKSVNLARLTTLSINGYGNSYQRPTNSTQSQIVYYNIPSQINLNNFDFFFANYPINGLIGMQGNEVDHSLQVGFNNYAGDYAYVLFPQEGLYNLHVQKNATDSVDCSHLDTAIQLTFNRTVPFTANSSDNSLYGILDTTDPSKAIAFTDFVQTSWKTGVDFEYAPIPTIQKYEMEYDATLPNNDELFAYSYAKTLPQNLLRPQGNDFSVTVAQADNFSVTFPGLKPTSYTLHLNADSTLQYQMLVSPDSANVHPMSFLTNLKSRFLASAHLNNLTLKLFTMNDFNGLNYLNYSDYITSQAAMRASPVYSVTVLMRYYN